MNFTPNERAAADVWRRFIGGAPVPKTKLEDAKNVLADALVRLIDAEPADGGEPITREWLVECGGRPAPSGKVVQFTVGDERWIVVDGSYGEWAARMQQRSIGRDRYDEAFLRFIKTKADFRRLAAALGIKLKEGK